MDDTKKRKTKELQISAIQLSASYTLVSLFYIFMTYDFGNKKKQL
jgi:hypothetical protein